MSVEQGWVSMYSLVISSYCYIILLTMSLIFLLGGTLLTGIAFRPQQVNRKMLPIRKSNIFHVADEFAYGCIPWMSYTYYRSGISIYSYLPAHGGDSPTTAPLTNSRDCSGVSGNYSIHYDINGRKVKEFLLI
jgi:hypothetical protein